MKSSSPTTTSTSPTFECEWCDGTVTPQVLIEEVFRHRLGFVILENVPAGVCDKCGRRYYSAAVLRKVEAVARGDQLPTRLMTIPVAPAV